MKSLQTVTAVILTYLLCFLTACSNISTPPDDLGENINEEDIYTFNVTNDWGRNAICFENFDSSGLRIAVIDSTNYYNSENVTNYSVCNLIQEKSALRHGSYIVSALCSLLPNAEIICINVADENNNITDTALADGILYASNLKCDIINISLGTQKNYQNVKYAVEKAIENECIVIAASGNESQTEIDFPAQYPDVISVMSRNIDNIDDITNNVSETKKSISAPGSIVFNDCYIFSGSSISTVYVVAEVAFIISNQPELKIPEVYSLLTESCVFSTKYSYGMINHRIIKENVSKEEE